GERTIRFRSRGAVTFDLQPLAPRWWGSDTIFLGATGRHPDAVPFTVSSQDPALQGVRALDDLPRAVAVGYDPKDDLWQLTVLSTRQDILLGRIVGEAPLSDVARVRWPASRGAGRIRLLRNRGGRFEDVTAAAGLDVPASCVSVAAGDFDDDMDLDFYLSCTGAVRNAPNRLFA